MTETPALSPEDAARFTPALARELVRLRCRHGEMFVPRHDLYIGRSLGVYGEYAEQEVALFARYIRDGQTIVDVGANIGAHTLAFAGLSPAGQVVAIEPEPAHAAILRENLHLNAIANVRVVEAIAAAADGEARIAPADLSQPANFGLFAPDDKPGDHAVPRRALDSLGLETCDFIKCDVEGMEREVLEGARRTIARLRPVLYVENDRAGKAMALVALLHEMDYRTWWHTPRYFAKDNFNGRTDDVFGGLIAANLLCLHRTRSDAPKGFVEITRARSAWPPIVLNRP